MFRRSSYPVALIPHPWKLRAIIISLQTCLSVVWFIIIIFNVVGTIGFDDVDADLIAGDSVVILKVRWVVCSPFYVELSLNRWLLPNYVRKLGYLA